MSGGGRGGGGGRNGAWGGGCRRGGGEQAFPESERTKPYGKQERKNKTEWTNRKRTGNLLIKADRTGDSVLVRIYTSPAQTRACRWRPVAPAPVRTVTGTRLRSAPRNRTALRP